MQIISKKLHQKTENLFKSELRTRNFLQILMRNPDKIIFKLTILIQEVI